MMSSRLTFTSEDDAKDITASLAPKAFVKPATSNDLYAHFPVRILSVIDPTYVEVKAFMVAISTRQ